MTFDRWQAPDRDSPTTLSFNAVVELGVQLNALFKTEGRPGTREAAVMEASGVQISRPRRWHKMFERMGLLFQDSDGNTQLTELGVLIRDCGNTLERDFRRAVASHAIEVLRRYQLLNPADTEIDTYPADTDCHPYWAIWKAAVSLEGKLHWDELNRELMWVLKHSELDDVIAKIRRARAQPGYDPVAGGSELVRLRDRAYDQTETTDNRDPSGQVRDQKTTPWFKRAGLGELLLIPPGREGNGYWSIHPDILDLIAADVSSPPNFRLITDKQEWFNYFGKTDISNGLCHQITTCDGDHVHQELSELDSLPLPTSLPETDPILTQVREMMAEGSGGVLFSGPPGTSKSWYARQVAGKIVAGDFTRVSFVQFHPSMGYDDFIEGYVPTIVDGATSFLVKKKIFLKICETAVKVAPQPCILVIDELNRGDTGRIFGEILTYIEPAYRGKTFHLSYSGLPTQIPSNLFIIGTFNPYDKSVVELDDAIDRRFDRISLDPSTSILNQLLIEKGATEEFRAKIIPYFVKVNKLTKHGLGHTLFCGITDDRSLANTWNRKLKYILEKAFRFEPESFSVAKQDYLALFDNPEASGI